MAHRRRARRLRRAASARPGVDRLSRLAVRSSIATRLASGAASHTLAQPESWAYSADMASASRKAVHLQRIGSRTRGARSKNATVGQSVPKAVEDAAGVMGSVVGAASPTQALRASRAARGTGLLDLSVRAKTIADAVGGQGQLAAMLEVNKSQPSHWIKGTEKPNPGNARQIVDLEYVVARIQLLWPASMVGPWLTAPNPFLGQARPIDVLRLRGSQPVIEALDAEASGVYA